jgi:hypothetical protein
MSPVSEYTDDGIRFVSLSLNSQYARIVLLAWSRYLVSEVTSYVSKRDSKPIEPFYDMFMDRSSGFPSSVTNE